MASTSALAAEENQSAQKELSKLAERYYNRVGDLEYKDRESEAFKLSNIAVEKFPNNLGLRLQRFNIAQEMKNYQSALQDCNWIMSNILQSMSRHLKREDWFFKRAGVEFHLGDYENAIKDCDEYMKTFPDENMMAAYFLKSEIYSSMGRMDEARKAFNEGAYLAASDYHGFGSSLEAMRRAAKPLGYLGTRNEKDTSFMNGFTFEEPKPRVKNNSIVLDRIMELTKLQAPDSVATLEPILEFKARPRGSDDLRLATHGAMWHGPVDDKEDGDFGGPTTMWKRIWFVRDKNQFNSKVLRLVPNPLFSTITADDITAKFGPSPPLGRVSHAENFDMRYTTPSVELSFGLRCPHAFKSLSIVRLRWITEEERTYLKKIEGNRARQAGMIGVKSQEVIDWARRLIEMGNPISLEEAEKMFGQKLNPLRESAPKSWTLGSHTPKYNGPVYSDFGLTYAPEGEFSSAAQLNLNLRENKHALKREQLEKAFGPGTILSGTRLDPRPTNKRLIYLSYPNDNGSMTAVCDTQAQGVLVTDLIFWWKGNSTFKCLEELSLNRTPKAIISDANQAVMNRDFVRARYLLDSARVRIDNDYGKKPKSLYEDYALMRAGYLSLFKAMHRSRESAYLQQVSCVELLEDLNNQGWDPDGLTFPTVHSTSENRWMASSMDGVRFLDRNGIGQLTPQYAKDVEAFDRLFGNRIGRKFVNPPADLIDSIYFDLQADQNSK